LIGDAFVYASQHDRTYTDGRLRDAYALATSCSAGWTPFGQVGAVRTPGYYDEAAQTFYEIGYGTLAAGNNAWR